MYVYILKSKLNPKRHYVGITRNLKHRLDEHNKGESTHTSKYRPWQIIAAIWIADAAKARLFEKYLKSGSGRAFSKKHFA